VPHLIARPRKGDRPDRPSTWLLTWESPRADGRRRRLTETFHGTKTEAFTRLRARQAEIDTQGKAYTPPSKATLDEYLAHWTRTYVRVQLRASTADNYERLLRLHVLPELGQVPLADLTPPILQAWVATLAEKPSRGGKPLSSRTITYVRAILHAALEEAFMTGAIPANPLDRVRPPRQQPKLVESFTLKQVRRLDEAAEHHRLRVLFAFLWQTGLRIGEALALRWEDVDLSRATLVVCRNLVEIRGRMVEQAPKTAAGRREIALPQRTVEMLRQHRENQDAERALRGDRWNQEGLVFPSEAGTALFRRNVQRAYHLLRERAGLPPYGIHALRHTAASLWLQAGVGIREIAATLGHESPGFTAKVYAHVLEQTKRQAAEKFDAMLSRLA
jgi:integrase